MIVCYAASQSIKEKRSVFVMIVRNLHRTEYNSPKVNIMVSKPFWSNFFVTHYNFTNHFQNFQSFIYVWFIPCFHHLVFGILVTLVVWFSLRFFYCLAYLALQNVNKHYVIFLYFHNFVAKSDQKPKTKNGMSGTIKNINRGTWGAT